MSAEEKDPERLIDEGDAGADLLKSAKKDGPSEASREATLSRLGLLAVGASEVVKTGAAAMVVAKVGVALVVAAAAVGVAVSRSGAPGENTPLAQSASVSAPAVEVSGAPKISEAPSNTTPKTVGPKHLTPPVASAPIAPSAVNVTPPTQEEVLLIEEARSAVTRGDQVSANAALARYARDYPHGALAIDANVLRVEVLVHWGDNDKARALANETLAKNPDEPAKRRLLELLRAIGP